MRRSAQITLLCTLFAFAATGIVSRVVFERLPHLEDEFAYLYQARIFARGEVSIDLPRPIRAYWQPFLISTDTDGDGRVDNRFGKYTPGWPLVLAVGERLHQSWIVNAWLAMLTVAMVYRLGREIYNPETGAVAAILTATSPAALLLNGTLMGHSASLFFATLFIYALWRLEKRRRDAPVWGLVGGAALGLLVITRPLTGLGIAAPFVLYSLVRVIAAAVHSRRLGSVLIPLLALGLVAILIGLIWPAFNYSVVKHPGESFPSFLGRFLQREKDTDLYRYVWDYDRVGFGKGYGRNQETGHTPELGWKHTKKDLSCAARDLFGWAKPAERGLNAEIQQRAGDACLKNGRGYSWLLLPFGFLLAVYRRWTWLLLLVPVSLVGAYIAYWIGGDLYSARYYYEALTAAAVVSAAGLVQLGRALDQAVRWLRRGQPADLPPRSPLQLDGEGEKSGLSVLSPTEWERGIRGEGHTLPPALNPSTTRREGKGRGMRGGMFSWLLYGALAAVTAFSLVAYSPARIEPLRGYGRIGQWQIEQVNAARPNSDRPVVVIAWGKHHWREIASLMAVTDPYLDSEIVLAREPDWNRANLDALRERWAGRDILYYMHGSLLYDLPADVMTVDTYHFFFYEDEGAEAPHVHVASPEGYAKFWLNPVRLDWNNGYKSGQLEAIQTAIEGHLAQLVAAWDDRFARAE